MLPTSNADERPQKDEKAIMQPRPVLILTIDKLLPKENMQKIIDSIRDEAKREYFVLIADKDLNMKAEIVANDILHGKEQILNSQ